MTFINLSLLLGLGLAAIPVVLHLMMRSRPKRIEFPALRLLAARRSSNARRMKLRQLLLLLLRMAVVALIVLALTRPSLPPARYGLVWYEWLLLLAVVAGSIAAWRVLTRRAAAQETAEFLRRERLGRIRALSLVGAVLAAVLVVGVPWGLRIQAEIQTPRADLAEDVPVAAVFLFDTSMSMSYRHESITRLEHAGKAATEHLQMLPQGSRVAVSGSGPDDKLVFQADLAGAQSRIDSLTTVPRTATLNRMLQRAVEAQQFDRRQVQTEGDSPGTGDQFAREVYVFTDLSKNAWSVPDEAGLRDLLVEYDWLRVFLIDVSVEDPVNLALRNLRLSDESTVSGRSIDLTVDVVRTESAPTSVNVEVYLISDLGEEISPTAPVHVQLDSLSQPARMTVPVDLSSGALAGVIRLSSSDPLKADDTRYFSLGVQPRPRILLVADQRDGDVHFLKSALEASDGGPGSQPFYDTTFVRTTQMQRQPLARFDVVCLVNCRRPSRELWQTLHEWVERGGSLFTIAGGDPGLSSDAWCVEESGAVLPGWVLLQSRARDQPETFRFDTAHPVIRAFEYDVGSKTELLVTPIYRWWKADPFPESRVIMSVTGERSSPALLERRVGDGRSLMLTTSVGYNSTSETKRWNELPNSYTFIMLAEGVIQYLSGASDQQRNFTAGDPIELQLPAARQFDKYLLRRPGPRQTSAVLESTQRSVLIDDADDPGAYRLMSPPGTQPFEAEFAVNLDDQETDLTRLEPSDLDDMLGRDRYLLVRNPEELERIVRSDRLGVEVFPVLLAILVVMFCGEHLMANFFYDQEAVNSESVPAAR